MQHYTNKFYTDLKSTGHHSADQIVPLLIDWIQPRSVIDIGCGTGTWLSVFNAHHVEDVCGVDGAHVDPSKIEIPVERFITFDLQKPFRIDRRFDLALSLEVGEHLPPNSAQQFVDSLVRLAPVVLFSAAIPFQGGIDHVNEQWQDYWAELFRERNYLAIDCIRRRVWQNPNVSWYYAQNMLLYAEQEYIAKNNALKLELQNTAASQLSVVHPTRYLATADLQNVPLRKLLRALPDSFVHGLRRTLKHSTASKNSWLYKGRSSE